MDTKNEQFVPNIKVEVEHKHLVLLEKSKCPLPEKTDDKPYSTGAHFRGDCQDCSEFGGAKDLKDKWQDIDFAQMVDGEKHDGECHALKAA
jgi:hypothetical protein